MSPHRGLSPWQVPDDPSSGFPFDSPTYDPLSANGLRCRSLLNDVVRLSETSHPSMAYFEVSEGRGYMYDGLDFDDADIADAVYKRLENPAYSLRVLLIPQEENTRRRPFMISRPAFEGIFKAMHVPVRFIELLSNNNGDYQVTTTYSDIGAAHSFHLLIKLPASFLNAAIYFRHNISTKRNVCLILGNRLHTIKPALRQTFPSQASSSSSQKHARASPLTVMNVLISEYVTLMEPERQALDIKVRELEAKTGMSAHVFDESQRAAAHEHTAVLKDLHVCEGLLAFFERTTQFQVGWIEWLQVQQATLNQLRFGTRELLILPPANRQMEEIVASSLGLCSSLSKERLEQVRTLRNRIRIQLSVVANSMTQNDGRTNIAIAEASRRIAFETKRDSDAMKTIAALTMAFLPATFVATLFGMAFFIVDSDSASGFRVNSLWWIYLAITLPLTMLTVGLWLGWLKWVRWRRGRDEESLGLKEKSS